MRTVAVYPGRFHVFHKGHKAVYDHLVKQFGEGNVYILTSAKQDPLTSPFTYADKVAMMTKMGVPATRIIQISNPYKKDEIAQDLGLNPNEDCLVYGLGGKDATRFKYTPTSPLQPYTPGMKMAPVKDHAYVETVPTIKFKVQGQEITDASQVRKLYNDGNDSDRVNIITDLYGAPDPELKDIFDKRLGTKAANPIQERREHLLVKINEMREQLAKFRRLQLTEQTIIDYIDEKKSR